MRLSLLALYYSLATRNETSAMVRICKTRSGRKLLVRAGNIQFTLGDNHQ